MRQCEEIFGPGRIPATAATNQVHGGRRPTYTNVFFSDFSDDPWQGSSNMRRAVVGRWIHGWRGRIHFEGE
eukprot:9404171-Pyramimonas_sp.AAC.2